jgi:putative protease
MTETKLGKVKHYFGKVSVAIILCEEDGLAIGETIHIKGHKTDMTVKVDSLQSHHETLTAVEKGKDVAVKVTDKVRTDDEVFKVKE